MDCKRLCAVCGDAFSGDGVRCSTCGDALRKCDRPTYDLILGLLKRIDALEGRFDSLPE